jgi:hypothetical protein
MTLQELVQYKRAALELKQSEYLAQSRTLFIEQLVKLFVAFIRAMVLILSLGKFGRG